MPALLVVVKIGDDLCEGTGPEKIVNVSSNYCWFQNTLSVFLRFKFFPICFCSLSQFLCVNISLSKDEHIKKGGGNDALFFIIPGLGKIFLNFTNGFI